MSLLSSGTGQRASRRDAGGESHGVGSHGMQPMTDQQDGGSMARQHSTSLSETYMPSRLRQAGAVPTKGSGLARSAQPRGYPQTPYC